MPRPSAGLRSLRLVMWAVAIPLVVALAVLVVRGAPSASSSQPAADAGPAYRTSLASRPLAPNFTLTDQFGQTASLASFRGRAVLLAFVDSECTTVCPLTTQSMVEAVQRLGAAAGQVQLLGIDANPDATAISDVMAYSAAHHLTNSWRFLTGSLNDLENVWRSYGILVQVVQGAIDHTPALYLIDPSGHERDVYLTPMTYGAVSQIGLELARDLASVLPGHPAVANGSLAIASGIGPQTRDSLPLLTTPGGQVVLGGPSNSRLLVFWASWVPDSAANLRGLQTYAASRLENGLPPLLVVDVGAVEPAPDAALPLLAQAPQLTAAEDASGAVADGYLVQDLPWYVFVDSSGSIAWSHDGWLDPRALEQALARVEAKGPK